MCLSAIAGWVAANAATIGTVASVVGAGAAAYGASQAGKGPDPVKAQAEADARATQNANGRLAARRQALSKNSLLSGGGDVMSTGILNGGRATLGGA